MYKKCLAIFALASLAAASLNEAGVNLGGDSLDEIDRKVEALLQKNNLDVEAFTTEYLISNGLKLSLDEARAVVAKLTDADRARDDQFLRQLAKVFDLCERLTDQLTSCPATKTKKASSLIKAGRVREVKTDLVAFVDEWQCPKEEKKKFFESKFFGSNGLQWQYFEDMRVLLKTSPAKAIDKLMFYAKDSGLMPRDTPPMVNMVVEQLMHNPDVAEYGITFIDWAETFFKSESGKRINGMLPKLLEADSEEALEMFTKEADYNQEAFFGLIDNSDVADGFLKNVAHYVVMANTWVREALADNMKFAMLNGFLIGNKMPVIDRRNIIKSASQIIDRGINNFSPWRGNYNFYPTILEFMDEFEKVYFKIDHVKKMQVPELENVLRQFMQDNLMEPIKDAYLANRHVTNVDFHCAETTICLFNEIYRDRTSINTMMVGGISMGLIYSWDALYEGHDTKKLYDAMSTGQFSTKPCKSVYLTAPDSCDVFEVRRRQLSGGMNLGYEHVEL